MGTALRPPHSISTDTLVRAAARAPSRCLNDRITCCAPALLKACNQRPRATHQASRLRKKSTTSRAFDYSIVSNSSYDARVRRRVEEKEAHVRCGLSARWRTRVTPCTERHSGQGTGTKHCAARTATGQHQQQASNILILCTQPNTEPQHHIPNSRTIHTSPRVTDLQRTTSPAAIPDVKQIAHCTHRRSIYHTDHSQRIFKYPAQGSITFTNMHIRSTETNH